MRLTLETPWPPDEMSITAWRQVDRFGEPTGNSTELNFQLLPELRGNEIVQTSSVEIPNRTGPLFVIVGGVWTDKEGTFEPQDAAWGFALRVAEGN